MHEVCTSFTFTFAFAPCSLTFMVCFKFTVVLARILAQR